MKLCIPNSLLNRNNVAIGAIIAALSLAAEPASAQAYIGHPQLTPYQLVSSDGRCLEFHIFPSTGSCNNIPVQIFYVVKNSDPLADFIPQTDVVDAASPNTNARIISASEFDKTSGTPGYATLYYDPTLPTNG